jgi:7-cyano-7-deazaguanine synthase in queuosine biosynthesis
MGKGDKGTMKRAVALASGGLDSSTVLALARKQGFDVYALSFDYGQRHRCELAAARRIAHSLGIAHHVVASVDLRAFGGSALTADIEVPKSRALTPGNFRRNSRNLCTGTKHHFPQYGSRLV